MNTSLFDMDFSVLLLAMLTGAVLGAAFAVAVWEVPKRECEAELPRNVECVWAAPHTTNQEKTK